MSFVQLRNIIDQAGVSDGEGVFEDVIGEIQRRGVLAPRTYPFQVKGKRLDYETKEYGSHLSYLFQLLVVSQARYTRVRVDDGAWIDIAKLFEGIVTLALKNYLKGEAENVGSPRRGVVPPGFDDSLTYITNRMFEERRSDAILGGNEKDDSVDVIGWAPFRDQRAGKAIIMVQCATGSDYIDKDVELRGKLEDWYEYVRWGSKPLIGFAFPFVCVDDNQWRRFSRRGGIVFDRTRLASLVGDLETTPELAKELDAYSSILFVLLCKLV